MKVSLRMKEPIRESWTSIPVADGEMSGFLAEPSASRGGIVLLQEIFGVNEAMRDAAHSFAAEGYTVLAPDLFWRIDPRIELGYAGEDRKRAFDLMQKYDQAAGANDIMVAVTRLRKHLASKPVVLVGFCLGGRMAVLAGAGNPDVAAIVSFYGVRLDLCVDEIRSITVPFQFHVGDQDAHVPAEHVTAVTDVIAANPIAEVFVYPSAGHGFYNRLRPEVFAADAAALANSRVLPLLQRVTA